MMHPLFKNKTVMTKKTCKQFLAVIWPATAGISRIVMFAIAGLAFLYCVYMFLTVGFYALGSILSIMLFAGVACFLGFRGYFLQQGVYIKKQTEAWNGDSFEKEISFYEDEIVQTSKLGEQHFKYRDVERFLYGGNIMALKMEKGSMLLLKDGFIDGTADDFHAFIRKKCGLDAKGKKPVQKK